MASVLKVVPVTPAVWDLFFELLSQGNTATMAARTLGVSLRTLQKARERDPEIRRQWSEADDAGTEALEQEAYRRAVLGIEKGLFYQGERFGSEREYSDQLLIVLLKARCPEKYKDRLDVKHDLGPDIIERLRAGRERAALAGRVIDIAPRQVLDADDPILA